MDGGDKRDILDAITHIDGKNEQRSKDLHERINKQDRAFQSKMEQQTRDFTTTVREMSVDQAELKALVARDEKDIQKLDDRTSIVSIGLTKLKSEVTAHVDDNGRHTSRWRRGIDDQGLGVEQSFAYKLLTSKAFWGGIAGAILLLVLGILKATGTI